MGRIGSRLRHLLRRSSSAESADERDRNASERLMKQNYGGRTRIYDPGVGVPPDHAPYGRH